MTNSKIDGLEIKKNQLENLISLEKNKLKTAARKTDTRQKIICGAIVLKLINEHESFKEFFIKNGLDKYASDRDRKLLSM